jgi:hypothetical protein
MFIPSLRQKLCPHLFPAATALLQQSSSTAAALHSWAQPSQFQSLCLLGIRPQPPTNTHQVGKDLPKQYVSQSNGMKLEASSWRQQQQQHVQPGALNFIVLQQQLDSSSECYLHLKSLCEL